MSSKPTMSSQVDEESARQALLNAVCRLEDYLDEPQSPQASVLVRIKRSVQILVDQVQGNGEALLRAQRAEASAPGLAAHGTRVSILSLAIGNQLGMDRATLYELGVSGLLHDIGKRRLSPDVVDKRGPLDESEWQEMQRHPVEGLVLLQSAHYDQRATWRPMLAAYEHHMKIDQSGYPRVHRPRKVSLFSRIVAVADVFDAVTSPRSYRSRPWPQAVVLRNMLEHPRWGLDKAIVKVLIQIIGLYPVGSFLQLQDGRQVTVVGSRKDAYHAPRVRVIGDAEGHAVTDGPELELVDETVAISRTLAPEALPDAVAAMCATARSIRHDRRD